jgi:hypothetical protein
LSLGVLPIILIGSLSVLVLDTGGSLASRRFGFPYPWLALASWVIYALVGIATIRRTGSAGDALLAGVLVGAVDATIGWAISWRIGPGAPAVNARGPVQVGLAAVLTAASAGCVAWLASGLT